MITIRKIAIASIFFWIFSQNTEAQFYNGHQMTFGKNRVQYNQFFWQYYRFDRFDTYFNEFGKDLAEFTAEYVEDEITRVEKLFDYTLEKRLVFICFNKLSDFRQTNIGLVSGVNEYNTGGVTKIINNKIFVYFEGDHENLKRQISASIAEIVIHEMLYGNNIRNNITNSTLINLPEWYLKGLYSYVSEEWSISIENHVKDGIVTGKFDKINRLTGQNAVYAGHSFWNYIAKNYGQAVIPNIIYLTRINKNAKTAFLYVLGRDIKDLSNDWISYFYSKYYEEDKLRKAPEQTSALKRTKKEAVYLQAKIDPSGRYIAYTENHLGRYKILVYDKEKNKKKKIEKEGHKIEQIVDYSYPAIAWHPTGKVLAYITEEKGRLVLSYYQLDEKETTERFINYFDKVLDFDYANDGLTIVMSAVKESKTDIYTYSLTSRTFEHITNDFADDFHPRYVDNSNKIIFSSTRLSDTLTIEEESKKTAFTRNLFIYDLQKKSKVLTRLGEPSYFNLDLPQEVEKNTYICLSDENGITNQYLTEYDSTISHVDTSIHYRYFTKTYPLSDYNRNIQHLDFNPKTNRISENIYQNHKHQIFTHPVIFDKGLEVPSTDYRETLTKNLKKKDSLRNIKKKIIPISSFDTSMIIIEGINDTIRFDNEIVDINNYVFEKEKIHFYNEKYKKHNIEFVFDTIEKGLPKIRVYETSFYINYLVNQVDFNFLNNSYQPYNGGAVYYNPGLSLLFKLGTNDLFEDYKIVGGVRFATDFNSNEYLISVENLKKRWDKQALFHRNAYENIILSDLGTVISRIKTHTHELIYKTTYPFSQVSAFGATIRVRYDKSTFLSTNEYNLKIDDLHKLWSGLLFEYTFDNTRSLGINVLDGTRAKVFGEAYLKLNGKNDDMYVLGLDYRHYEKIHRNLIWATRFATSTSFGKARLLYYLGSIDNWLVFPAGNAFDNDVPVKDQENYAYQTLATNMRGFKQNIRNGNSFALINTEIRWPFVSYFSNYPISSSFWNSLQLVTFFDIGTAWSGVTPWSGENAYDTEEIKVGPSVTIRQDANRNPIVYGYGAGFRTQLLGYFVRVDWAWGIENNVVFPYQFYLSLSRDF